MQSPVPFINSTTIGSITDEATFPAIWNSILRTIVSTLLKTNLETLIILIFLIRSTAAAAQVVTVDGHRGGSLKSIWELFTNRRSGALPHHYKRRWSTTMLFLSCLLVSHATHFTIDAFIQQKGNRSVQVSKLPLKLWRISNKEVRARFGCVNKALTYRDGQSDLAISMCNNSPVPVSMVSECVALVCCDVDTLFGIYHPRMLNTESSVSAGVTFFGPMIVTGNTHLSVRGTLPILEVQISEELVRNLFRDMVEGEIKVPRFQVNDTAGSPFYGMALCGTTVNATSHRTINKLVGGLGFVEGDSRILDHPGQQISVLVKTSASRTSIYTVLYIGVAAIAGNVLLFLIGKAFARIAKRDTDISGIITTAISQVCGNDCAMPAAVANGNVNLARVNTIQGGVLHLGVYPSNTLPPEAAEKDGITQE